MVRQEFADAAGRLGRQLLQNVPQVDVGVMPVESFRMNQAHHCSGALARAQTVGKYAIVSADGNRAYLVLYPVVYFMKRPPPKTPHDLTEHVIIRLPTYGGLYPWEFKKDGRELNVRVDGQLIVNGMPQIISAAVAGLGLAFILIPSLLPQPSAVLTGICSAGGYITLLGLTRCQRPG